MKLKRHIDATIGSGNLREVVRLPVGEDLNEWLAVNSEFILDTFFFLMMIDETVVDELNLCTPSRCLNCIYILLILYFEPIKYILYRKKNTALLWLGDRH